MLLKIHKIQFIFNNFFQHSGLFIMITAAMHFKQISFWNQIMNKLVSFIRGHKENLYTGLVIIS